MRISCAIAALNEGPDLEATVALLLAGTRPPDEIVVVDDCSAGPVRNLRRIFGSTVRTIRNKTRTGSGPAKHRAAEECTGDLVIVMDAHLRPPSDALELLVREHEWTPKAVLSPLSTGVECRRGGFLGHGAVLKLAEEGFWKPEWAPKWKEDLDSYRMSCVLGGCYAIPRKLLSAVGGYAPGLRGYGIEEEYLSLRAWLCGFECRVCPRVIMPHRYKRNVDRTSGDGQPQTLWAMAFNRHTAALVCFGDALYRTHYKPRIEAASYGTEGLEEELKKPNPGAAATRERIQRARVMNDDDLAACCGVVHPGQGA
jgi:glycosyltransferase involved in cell wall biosynthesis